MNIEYNIGIDDIVSYNLYYYHQSPYTKRQLENTIVFYAGIALIILILGFMSLKNDLALSIILFGLALLFIWLASFASTSSKRSIIKNIRLLYGSNSGKKNSLGKHTLTITPEYIKIIDETGDSTITWDAIDKIDTTDSHIFIFLRPGLSCIIMPKRAFPDDSSLNLFIETAKKYQQAANPVTVRS